MSELWFANNPIVRITIPTIKNDITILKFLFFIF